MNLQNFTQMVRGKYRNRLVNIIEQNREKSEDRTKDNNKIMVQIFLIKVFQVMQLIVFILILSYFLGAFWFVMTKHTTPDEEAYTFYNQY